MFECQVLLWGFLWGLRCEQVAGLGDASGEAVVEVAEVLAMGARAHATARRQSRRGVKITRRGIESSCSRRSMSFECAMVLYSLSLCILPRCYLSVAAPVSGNRR